MHHRPYIFIAHQLAYVCRARYCYGKSVRLSITLYSSIVLK